MCEIDNSLHFYTHMGRSQKSEVKALYLTGESAILTDLSERLRTVAALDIKVLSPDVIITSAESIASEMAAVLGAGKCL